MKSNIYKRFNRHFLFLFLVSNFLPASFLLCDLPPSRISNEQNILIPKVIQNILSSIHEIREATQGSFVLKNKDFSEELSPQNALVIVQESLDILQDDKDYFSSKYFSTAGTVLEKFKDELKEKKQSAAQACGCPLTGCTAFYTNVKVKNDLCVINDASIGGDFLFVEQFMAK